MTDWIMTEEERRPDREIYYISEDDPVVKLMEAHKEALAEIERLENVVKRDREIERLRDALREIRDLAGTSEDMSRIAAHTLGVRYD